MSFQGYEIVETGNGPMVSQSRTTIYDILLTQQEGEDFNAICMIHNLKPLQVMVGAGVHRGTPRAVGGGAAGAAGKEGGARGLPLGNSGRAGEDDF